MILYLAILMIQVMLIIDVIRNGRNQIWIMVLMFLPGPGTIAYLVIEVYPRFQGNRHVRTARAAAVAKLNPEREVRAARDALDLADTAANRIRLADALAALGRHGEALPLLREAIQRGPLDLRTGEKLARAEYETGDAAGALATLDAIRRPARRATGIGWGCCARRCSMHWDARTRRWSSTPISSRGCPARRGAARYAALLLEQGWEKKARAVVAGGRG